MIYELTMPLPATMNEIINQSAFWVADNQLRTKYWTNSTKKNSGSPGARIQKLNSVRLDEIDKGLNLHHRLHGVYNWLVSESLRQVILSLILNSVFFFNWRICFLNVDFLFGWCQCGLKVSLVSSKFWAR